MKKKGMFSERIVLLVVLLLVMFLVTAYPQAVFILTLIMPVYLLIILLCMLMPIGKHVIGGSAAQPIMSRPRWFARIAGLQCLYVLLFMALITPFVSSFTAHPAQVAQVFAFVTMGQLFFSGLHPWTSMAMVAVALACLVRDETQYKMSALLTTLVKAPTMLVAGCDLLPVLCTFMMIFMLVGYAILQCLAVLLPMLGLSSIYSGELRHFLILLMTLFIISRKSLRHWVLRMGRGEKTIFRPFLIISALVMGVTLVLEVLTALLGGDAIEVLKKPFAIDLISDVNNEQGLLLLAWGWGILSVPIFSVWIARLSKGRQVREVIGYVLLLPLLFTFMAYNLIDVYRQQGDKAIENFFIAMQYLVDKLLHPPIGYALSLLGAVIVFCIIRQSERINQALVYMTPNIAGKKIMRLRAMTVEISTFMLVLMMFFLVCGLKGAMFIVLLMAVIAFILILFLAMLVLVKMLCKRQTL